MVHVVKHRGFKPIAFAAHGAFTALPTQQTTSAFGFGIGNLSFQNFQLRGACKRAQVGVRGQGIAHFETPNRVDQCFHEFVMNAGMHINTLDRAATLTGVVHGTICQGLCGRHRVSIGTHIGGIFAAQFQLELGHTRSHDVGNVLSRGQ